MQREQEWKKTDGNRKWMEEEKDEEGRDGGEAR